ncbi:repeat 5 [Octopus vulgaris]|uniref:Repeat 5 n=1 Tax=Octopus vulgaris TaxID=6645 RepID=A0AA36FS33_OCTVU|nr:repeat 5 [Octopus vulgaris]
MAEEEEQTETSEKTPLQCAEEAVNGLYDFRDHYFEKFSISKSHLKDEDVRKKMEECLELLSSKKDLISSKSQYFMLRGKALNVLPTYDKEAEVLLSKAVKLDPKLVEAWNHLGECYWKNKDITSAKNCFVGALNNSKNKVSLRNLSMVLRQIPGIPPLEKLEIVKESVEKAKDAVHMDITDGSSWANLGNAYLSLFFAEGQNPKTLKQAMSAYNQAVRDPVAKNNPDLHFNRAIAYKYQEDYQEALEGFSTAKALDCDWLGPVEQETRLLDFLTQLTMLQSSHGKMKAKKLINLSKSIKESDLGPYQGGSYTADNGRTVELKKKMFKELQPGVNKHTVVVGKVVCTISHVDPIPFVFCFIDEECNCLSVSLYNIGEGYGVKIGDSVAIPGPFLREVNVNFKDKVFSYRSIRVDSPVALVVNRRKLGVDMLAPMRLAIINLVD